MNTAKTLTVCALVFAMAMGLQACSHHGSEAGANNQAQATADSEAAVGLKITDYGPNTTEAGVVFNKQPDGAAAMWFRVNRSLDGSKTSIDFAGTLLPSIISGDLVAATVPPALYAKPGSYTLHLVAKKRATSVQSNDVKFTVE